MITPKRIRLHFEGNRIKLRIYAPECDHGSTVLENVPHVTGGSLPFLRRYGRDYAKRWGIPFDDETQTKGGK